MREAPVSQGYPKDNDHWHQILEHGSSSSIAAADCRKISVLDAEHANNAKQQQLKPIIAAVPDGEDIAEVK
jgi:hypothetical protein